MKSVSKARIDIQIEILVSSCSSHAGPRAFKGLNKGAGYQPIIFHDPIVVKTRGGLLWSHMRYCMLRNH